MTAVAGETIQSIVVTPSCKDQLYLLYYFHLGPYLRLYAALNVKDCRKKFLVACTELNWLPSAILSPAAHGWHSEEARQHHVQDCGISIKAPVYMAMEFAMSAYNFSAVELIEIPQSCTWCCRASSGWHYTILVTCTNWSRVQITCNREGIWGRLKCNKKCTCTH